MFFFLLVGLIIEFQSLFGFQLKKFRIFYISLQWVHLKLCYDDEGFHLIPKILPFCLSWYFHFFPLAKIYPHLIPWFRLKPNAKLNVKDVA